MRQIKYLSPTSITTWEKDREEFYLRYCADNRPPKIPQTKPMAIGSAFDAFVKNYLVGALGLPDLKDQFSIEKIFEEQVEPQNRDWAFDHGERLFNQYRESGALADLMIELGMATGAARFEFTVENRIAHSKYVDGIPLLGKPDAHIPLSGGLTLTNDWKVNGYCSKTPVSPKKGYTRIRPGGQAHKDCQTMSISGIPVNIGYGLETVDREWATQLCIYMWVLGEPVGTKSIVGIEQLACAGGETPVGLRVASHRLRVGTAFQFELMERIVKIWDSIQQGWIFDKLSLTESQQRCGMLDQQYLAYNPEGVANMSEADIWFRQVTRG